MLLRTALCGGYFLVLLDVTVVNVALPQLGGELGVSGPGLAVVVDAYAVPLAALLLAAGALGDRVGHRRIVLGGYLGFAASSVLCALAPAIQVLAAGRAAQGVSAALMLPGTLALLVESAQGEAARAHVVGLWAAVGGAALPAGPLVGDVLVQALGWRSVFWLGVPVILLALPPILGLPGKDVPTATTGVDWAGTALLVGTLGCFASAILRAGSDPLVAVVLGALAAAGGVLLWVVERRAAAPLLRVPRPRVPPLVASCAVAATMNLCVLGSLFVLTQAFQDVHGLTPLRAGLMLLPAMLPLPLLGRPAGRLTARLGAWAVSSLGLLVAAVGFVGVAAALAGPSYPWLVAALALWGSGIGILTPAVVTASVRAVPDAPGVASGASNTSRQTGGAIGVAVYGAVAGPAAASGFIGHAVALLVAGAVAFAGTSAGCLLAARRFAVAVADDEHPFQRPETPRRRLNP